MCSSDLLLGQMLHPQGHLEFLPPVRRETERRKEPGLEPSDGMGRRQEVAVKLLGIDFCPFEFRQDHEGDSSALYFGPLIDA